MRASIVVPDWMQEEFLEELGEFRPWILAKNMRPWSGEGELQRPKIRGRGEVLLDWPLFSAAQICLYSKLAHRVLWKLAEFEAREFYEIGIQLKKYKWPSWAGTSEVVVSSSQSKLGQEKRIEATIREYFGKALAKEKGTSSPLAPVLRVHVFQDVFRVSVDLSGESLHRRGYRVNPGKAPLRESASAWALRKLVQGSSQRELQEKVLWDPMCGAGSFMFEALEFRQWSSRAFYWPSSLDSSLKLLSDPQKVGAPILKLRGPSFSKIIGWDFDAQQVESAQKNLNEYLKFGKVNTDILIQTEDSVSESKWSNLKLQAGARKIWILTHPPFGNRLERKFNLDSVFENWVKYIQPERIGLVLPQSDFKWAQSRGETYPMDLGGKPGFFFLWKSS